jgi:peptidylprolyl isomerase
MEGPELREFLGIEPTTFSLDYVDTKIGTGPLAAPHKWYTINYTGYLVDGTKFDSSLDRKEPIVVPYGEHKVIPGWDTGFGGMHIGGKRRLFIPYELAYGANGRAPIPPKAELIFDVELLAQSDTDPTPKAPPMPPAPPRIPSGGTGQGSGQSAPSTPATPPNSTPPPTPPASTAPQAPTAPATPPPAGAPKPE